MNKLRVVFAILLTVVTLTHTKSAKAVVGTGGGAAIAGLALMGGGFISIRRCNDFGCLPLGAVLMITGLLLLDGEQEIVFGEINKEEAQRIGLTPAEFASYHSELDQVNSVLAEVSAELSQLENPEAEDAALVWKGFSNLINPLTFAAVKKIAAQR